MKSQVVIIPVHNQLPYLQRCITSIILKNKTPYDMVVIVVDDGSDKETALWIASQIGVSITEVITTESLGFSSACNAGIDFAMKHYDFECLCLLNSDTEIVTDDWFSKVEDIANHPTLGILGVMSDNAMHQTADNIDQYLSRIVLKPVVLCNLIHGFCYFITKPLLLEIGNLDSDTFPHYGSEDDYSFKALRAGYQNVIVGNVFVHHHNCTSYTEPVRQQMIKKTMPDLIARWGRDNVERCIAQANKAHKYLNSK